MKRYIILINKEQEYVQNNIFYEQSTTRESYNKELD